jgi:hypothetical protein
LRINTIDNDECNIIDDDEQQHPILLQDSSLNFNEYDKLFLKRLECSNIDIGQGKGRKDYFNAN